MSSDPYSLSGVQLDAMDVLKERIKAFSAATHGPEVLNAQGGFAGLYQLMGYKEPVLVASVDGVGTKIKIAAYLSHFESIGQDLVTLNVNDVLARGGKPIFFLDYVSFSVLDQQRMDALMRGIAWGCHETGCALIGGETAQMPDLYGEDDMDLAGFVVGVAERGALIQVDQVRADDYLLGIASSGLHTNGFSLVRRVFDIDRDPSVLSRHYDELKHKLGEELLIRHRCYYPMLEPVLGLVTGLSHITGGGLPGKMPGVMPGDLAARFDPASWARPPIFDVIQREGNVPWEEMYKVFNMGLGMVAICREENLAEFQTLVPGSQVVGRIIPRGSGPQVIIQGL